ncbi:MAG: phosphate-binding protein [candidate division Zixibacteria bacterium SM23_73]|nr:MAG: phosphate-binding protein [candidate division Zixibacteria bacterium SM23_73]
MKKLALLIIGLVFLGSLVFAAKSITLKGSDTLLILGQKWAEIYMEKNPGTVVQVTGCGSGVGVSALINGGTDIAQASRPMQDKERDKMLEKRGIGPHEIPVAMDGITVYVNEKNPVEKLTFAQLKDIFQATVKNWKEVGANDAPIVLYGRENSSGTHVFFKEHVLKKEDYSVRVQPLPGTAAIVNAVAKDENGIGYGGAAYAKGVKELLVAKDQKSGYFPPTMENIVSAKYPISRYLFWYTAGSPKGDIKRLVDWILSPEGQKTVEEVGYFPLPTEKETEKEIKKEGKSEKK